MKQHTVRAIQTHECSRASGLAAGCCRSCGLMPEVAGSGLQAQGGRVGQGADRHCGSPVMASMFLDGFSLLAALCTGESIN